MHLTTSSLVFITEIATAPYIQSSPPSGGLHSLFADVLQVFEGVLGLPVCALNMR